MKMDFIFLISVFPLLQVSTCMHEEDIKYESSTTEIVIRKEKFYKFHANSNMESVIGGDEGLSIIRYIDKENNNCIVLDGDRLGIGIFVEPKNNKSAICKNFTSTILKCLNAKCSDYVASSVIDVKDNKWINGWSNFEIFYKYSQAKGIYEIGMPYVIDANFDKSYDESDFSVFYLKSDSGLNN